MISWQETGRLVERRAGGRGEYCRMHQSLQGATFHVEHIVPCSLGGTSELENLASACPGCNLRKSDRTEIPDPETGKVVLLFHPRANEWSEHFVWQGHPMIGLTPVGRAAVAVLDLNHPRRLLVRRAEELFGLFPP
jgi:HNH endonuclease